MIARRRDQQDEKELELHSSAGPYDNPVSRFDQIPRHTREMLEELSPEQVKLFVAALEREKTMQVLGRFWKWVFFGTITVFVAAWQGIDAVSKLLKTFGGGVR